MRSKLLTYLQDRSHSRIGGEEQLIINARIFAATNRDLKAVVDKGSFREDLYFRLNVLLIEVPPLRERKEDIPSLLDHFLLRLGEGDDKGRPLAVDPGVHDLLMDFDWPGNVRGIERTVSRAFVLRSDSNRLQRIDFDFMFGNKAVKRLSHAEALSCSGGRKGGPIFGQSPFGRNRAGGYSADDLGLLGK